MTAWDCALGGAAIAAVQAGLLARAARGRPAPGGPLARLVLVGTVLLLAARADHLAAGASGWAAGFVLAAARIFRRLG